MTIYFINWVADYELKMIQYLEKKYKIKNITTPKKYNWINKKISKIGMDNAWLGRLFIKHYLNDIKKDDIIIINDSVVNKGINKQILKNINCHKVLLLRNTVGEDFNVVKDKTSSTTSKYLIEKQISYEENIRRTLNANIIVDITKENQSGWTLRILEALFFNKKLITNNINVLGSEIYSESRFFIIGHDDWDKLEYFINSSVKPMDYDSLYKFSPDKMMSTIVSDFIDK